MPVVVDTSSNTYSSQAQTVDPVSSLGLGNSTSSELNEVLTTLSSNQQEDLISSINMLLTTERADGLDATELVTSMIHTLNNALSVHQANKSTCYVVGLESKIALENPAEYARLLQELTSADRSADLLGGGTLRYESRFSDPDTDQSGNPINGRQLSSRIIQSAFMQFAVGDGFEYSSAQDKAIDLAGGTGFTGVYPDMYQKLRNEVLGTGSDRLDTFGSRAQLAEEILQLAKDSINSGKTVASEIRTNTAGNHEVHGVLITKITDDGLVYFQNGWGNFKNLADSHGSVETAAGKVEFMSTSDFSKLLNSVYLDNASKPLTELTALDDNRKYDADLRGDIVQHANSVPDAATYTMTHKSLTLGIVPVAGFVAPLSPTLDVKLFRTANTEAAGGDSKVWRDRNQNEHMDVDGRNSRNDKPDDDLPKSIYSL